MGRWGFSNRALLVMAVVVPVALLSGVAALVAHKQRRWRRSCEEMQAQVSKLRAALEASVEQRAAERRGRIRAQQALRKSLLANDSVNSNCASYPMVPVGVIQSCFSTRNGTPRQPLIVPLARACLVLPPDGVPATALDGLAEYSHCWILYIFHANTDLPHIWKQPNHKDFKAKVRVPRLDGVKLGVYATRTPHRPYPIGLTVAKVEGVRGRMLMISGADLVDGTPVIDVKPYLPYCDSVVEAKAPTWVAADAVDDPLAVAGVLFPARFTDKLVKCWESVGKLSMYSSPEEFQELIKQVLSRDIRSVRQRRSPHACTSNASEDGEDQDMVHCETSGTDVMDDTSNFSGVECETANSLDGMIERKEERAQAQGHSVIYTLILEGLRVSYTVDHSGVVVHDVQLPDSRSVVRRDCNYGTWRRVKSP